MKTLLFIIGSFVCLVIASIIPSLMYFLYNLIAPTTVLERVAVLGLFWFGGGGLTLIAGVFAVMSWIYLLKWYLE